jgi:hypothetical protein
MPIIKKIQAKNEYAVVNIEYRKLKRNKNNVRPRVHLEIDNHKAVINDFQNEFYCY